MRVPLPKRPFVRVALVLGGLVAAAALVWWRGPPWSTVAAAFDVVRWRWVLAAIALNLLSIIVRSLAWDAVIRQAMPRPHPRFPLVFSAFSVGLMANAVLPGRIGELARVAVLTRRLAGRVGAWATLVGTVFAHRVFDVLPTLLLIAYVLIDARIPAWASTSLLIVVIVGIAFFVVALLTARHHRRSALDGVGIARRLLTMARYGLGVLRKPLPATVAALCQCLGWLFQLLAVYAALRAFHIHSPLPAAALVLLLMNVATIFPLWPGNVGLTQAAIALPLASQYGVPYGRAFAFGIGLQAIEASVGIGVGLLFLAREGLSFAMLRRMPEPTEDVAGDTLVEEEQEPAARSRIPA